MSSRLTIQSITGTSPYDFYVCDIYENNCSLLGSVSTDSPDPIFILTTPDRYSVAEYTINNLIKSKNLIFINVF